MPTSIGPSSRAEKKTERGWPQTINKRLLAFVVSDQISNIKYSSDKFPDTSNGKVYKPSWDISVGARVITMYVTC